MRSFRKYLEDMRIQERVWVPDGIVDMGVRQQKLDTLRQRVKKKRETTSGIV